MRKTALIVYMIVAIIATSVCTITKVLPEKYLMIYIGIIAAITAVFIFLLMKKEAGSKFNITAITSVAVIVVMLLAGSAFVIRTDSVVSGITDDHCHVVYSVVCRNRDKIENEKELDGCKIYISEDTYEGDKNAVERLTEDFSDKGINIKLVKSDNITDKLAHGKIDYAFMPEVQYEMICDNDSSVESRTRILYELECDVDNYDINESKDVKKDTFNILISGLDSTGKIDKTAKADMNMVATVNIKDGKILFTSIPKDCYVRIDGLKKKDSLAHSGIYGINETAGAIEKLLDIDIDFTIRCNFTTVTSLIDEIDGIDVVSKYSFKTHGRQNEGYEFNKGENHLTGNAALAFVREEKSFSDGEKQRIRNQQLVMEALIEKLSTSEKALNRYGEILGELSPYIETSMGEKQISELVNIESNNNVKWDIDKIAIKGKSEERESCLLEGRKTEVVIPYKNSIKKAVDRIAQISEGEDKK